MSIVIKEAVVNLTEKTLIELLRAVKAAKEISREEVMVESPYGNVTFIIHNEIEPQTQESMGYHKVSVKHNVQKDSKIRVILADSEPPLPEWIDIKMVEIPKDK